MSLFDNNPILVPREVTVPGGMKYCCEKAQQSLETSSKLGEVPEGIQHAATLFSRRERFRLMQPYLVSFDRREREAAVHIFGTYTEMLPALVESLSDKAWAVRAYAAIGLSNHPLPHVVQSLISMLRDPNAVVRMCAAHSLGEFGVHAQDALSALHYAAFDNEVLAHDPEEKYFLLPFSLSDLARLGLSTEGKDASSNWEGSTHQLFAREAYNKIKASLLNHGSDEEMLTEDESINLEDNTLSGLFLETVTNLESDEDLDFITAEQLMDVVREGISPACLMATSMLGRQGSMEELPFLTETLTTSSMPVHALTAITQILARNNARELNDQIIQALDTLLLGDQDLLSVGITDAIELLSAYPTQSSRDLLIKTVVLGGECAQDFATYAIYKMKLDSTGVKRALILAQTLAGETPHEKAQEIIEYLEEQL